MSEIKIDLTLKKKKTNCVILSCFKIAIIQVILMRQPPGQRCIFFYAVLCVY